MDKQKTVEVKTEVDDKEVVEKYVVKRPTNDIIRLADRHRAKVWHSCVMDDIPTKQSLRKQLADKGLWSDKESDKEKVLRKEIGDLEGELYRGDGSGEVRTIDEGKHLAINIRKKRMELTRHLASISEFERNCADSLANNARFDFLVSQCVFTEDGQRVYKDLADYDLRATEPAGYTCAEALAIMLHGIDSEFEESLPENKWLIDQGLVNKELSLVDEEGNLVDENGRRISEDLWYLDENGNKVDSRGNERDEKGNYISKVEYQKDVPAKKPKRKKTVAK